jgi:hypothetical protein
MNRIVPRPIASNSKMPQTTGKAVRKVDAADLRVGLVCSDRDGNRVRIDRVDPSTGTMSYHFLNDELRVQEGVREVSISQFLSWVWYVAR